MKFWSSHKHCFFEVDRQWMVLNRRNHGQKTILSSTPITKITERCADKSCGKYRQLTLEGHLPGGDFGPPYTAEETIIHE